LPTTDVTVTGTIILGTNWNPGTGKTVGAEAARDETDNLQGDIIWLGEIHATDPPMYLDLLGSLVLTKNRSIGVDYVTTGTACDVIIWGFFD